MTDTKDELLQLYGQANSRDQRHPAGNVRTAVLAHAQMVLDAKAKPVPARSLAAANFSNWKVALVASLLITPLIGILVSRNHEAVQEGKPVSMATQSRSASPAETESGTAPTAPRVASNADTARMGGRASGARADKALSSAPMKKTDSRAGSDRALASASPSADALPGARTDIEVAQSSAATPRHAMVPSSAAAEADPQSMFADAKMAKSRALAAPAGNMKSAPTPSASLSASPAQEQGAIANMNVQFFQAVREGRVQAMESLLARGISVNARDWNGTTALIVAVQIGHEDMVARLLDLGANPELVDINGLTALQYAKQLGHGQIEPLLERRR